MASWCVYTRQSPEAWMSLSRVERDAFWRAAKKANKVKKK